MAKSKARPGSFITRLFFVLLVVPLDVHLQCQARFLAAAGAHRPALAEGGQRPEQTFPAAENFPVRRDIFFLDV